MIVQECSLRNAGIYQPEMLALLPQQPLLVHLFTFLYVSSGRATQIVRALNRVQSVFRFVVEIFGVFLVKNMLVF